LVQAINIDKNQSLSQKKKKKKKKESISSSLTYDIQSNKIHSHHHHYRHHGYNSNLAPSLNNLNLLDYLLKRKSYLTSSSSSEFILK